MGGLCTSGRAVIGSPSSPQSLTFLLSFSFFYCYRVFLYSVSPFRHVPTLWNGFIGHVVFTEAVWSRSDDKIMCHFTVLGDKRRPSSLFSRLLILLLFASWSSFLQKRALAPLPSSTHPSFVSILFCYSATTSSSNFSLCSLDCTLLCPPSFVLQY